MPTPLLFPYGPFQPLGLITVATAGTPVPLTQNIGVYYSDVGKSEYAISFQTIIFQAPSTNTGAIYIVVAGGSANNSDSIIYTLASGATWSFSADAQSKNRFGLQSFWIDAATSGNAVQVSVYMAG